MSVLIKGNGTTLVRREIIVSMSPWQRHCRVIKDDNYSSPSSVKPGLLVHCASLPSCEQNTQAVGMEGQAALCRALRRLLCGQSFGRCDLDCPRTVGVLCSQPHCRMRTVSGDMVPRPKSRKGCGSRGNPGLVPWRVHTRWHTGSPGVHQQSPRTLT